MKNNVKMAIVLRKTGIVMVNLIAMMDQMRKDVVSLKFKLLNLKLYYIY